MSPSHIRKRKTKKETTFADEVLHSLNDFFQATENGEPITIRTLELKLEPAEYGPEDVRQTRQTLNVSQAVFAQLLSVSAKTVQSWEQGSRPVAGPARRLLDEFNSNTRYWKNVIRKAVREQVGRA